MSLHTVIRETLTGCTIALRVQPGARKTAITGIYGEGNSAQLKVAVHAPPVDGRANDALIAWLADAFHLPRASVELLSGTLNRSKVFLLKGVTRPQIDAFLAASGL